MNSIRLILPLLLSLMLLACSGGGNVKPGGGPAASSGTGDKAAVPPKRGGYYLDDGPGENPPANIDSIPDAVPRAEALLARANRPYIALGKRYTPATDYTPYRQRGIASWYGKRYHGQKTSSGEVYDMYGMTGAHPTLPLPSYVRVTNPENGRSVVVRINDRGPFHDSRLIDLSYAAAYKLRLLEKGSGLVEVEAINSAQTSAHAASTADQVSMPATVEPAAASMPAPLPSGNFVQVGAFRYQDNAQRMRQKLQQQNLAGNVAVENWYNAGTYRVRLGPYASRQDAELAAARIKQALGTSAIVITQ